MNRQQKPESESASLNEVKQLGLWDNTAAKIGLEPAYSQQDISGSKAKHKGGKTSWQPMEKWEKPFRREDGLIWVYVGYGDWEAHPPDYYRVKYQWDWLKNEYHFRGERKRLLGWLDIKQAREARERERNG